MTDAKRTAVITGGRDYSPTIGEFKELLGVLVRREIERVITGGARGVDAIVHEKLSALDETGLLGLELVVMPADWKTHGKAAGPIRNKAMLSEPGVRQLVAFKGGNGTWNCIQTAKRLGIDVHVVGEGKW